MRQPSRLVGTRPRLALRPPPQSHDEAPKRTIPWPARAVQPASFRSRWPRGRPGGIRVKSRELRLAVIVDRSLRAIRNPVAPSLSLFGQRNLLILVRKRDHHADPLTFERRYGAIQRNRISAENTGCCGAHIGEGKAGPSSGRVPVDSRQNLRQQRPAGVATPPTAADAVGRFGRDLASGTRVHQPQAPVPLDIGPGDTTLDIEFTAEQFPTCAADR
jgi:hypothetical protein